MVSEIEADLYQERGYEIKNNIQQIQLSGKWLNMEAGALDAINFGFAHTKYEVDSNNIYSDNFALGNGAMDISELDYDFRPGGIGFEYIPVFSANEFLEMVKAQSLYSEPDVKKDGITEETTAAYLSFDFVTDFNNMPFNASFGVRYEETDVESYSVQRPVTGFNWITPIQLSKVLADEERTEILEGAYEHFLPI